MDEEDRAFQEKQKAGWLLLVPLSLPLLTFNQMPKPRLSLQQRPRVQKALSTPVLRELRRAARNERVLGAQILYVGMTTGWEAWRIWR